jgi:hypothetical protein
MLNYKKLIIKLIKRMVKGGKKGPKRKQGKVKKHCHVFWKDAGFAKKPGPKKKGGIKRKAITKSRYKGKYKGRKAKIARMNQFLAG